MSRKHGSAGRLSALSQAGGNTSYAIRSYTCRLESEMGEFFNPRDRHQDRKVGYLLRMPDVLARIGDQ